MIKPHRKIDKANQSIQICTKTIKSQTFDSSKGSPPTKLDGSCRILARLRWRASSLSELFGLCTFL